MDFVQQAADRGIEPLNDRQQGFDVGALIGDLGEHLRLLLGEELQRYRGCISHAATLLAMILRTDDLAAHRASTSRPTAQVRASRVFLPASTRCLAASSGPAL